MPISERGSVEWYGGRATYFPPFVHQDTNMCTMTIAVMAAHVAFCGTKPNTQHEAKQLGLASGPFPDGGYNTRSMIAALKSRYGLKVRNESVGLDDWKVRLSCGYVVALGLIYSDLPSKYHAPGFEHNGAHHRVMAIGYDEALETTRLVDPLATGANHRGVDVPLKVLFNAVQKGSWREWQVWIKEAQAVLTTLTIIGRFDPLRIATLSAAPGRKFQFWNVGLPGVPAVVKKPPQDLRLTFDASGRIHQSDHALSPEHGTYIRIVSPGTPLDGMWLEVDQTVDADTKVSGSPSDQVVAAAVEAAVQQERADWVAWLAKSPDVAPPPNGDPGDALGNNP